MYDIADDMCPNCVTPWKCNGPHAPRKPAPFFVERDGDGWTLVMRPNRRIIWCDSQAEAIDYAYRNWPWWP